MAGKVVGMPACWLAAQQFLLARSSENCGLHFSLCSNWSNPRLSMPGLPACAISAPRHGSLHDLIVSPMELWRLQAGRRRNLRTTDRLWTRLPGVLHAARIGARGGAGRWRQAYPADRHQGSSARCRRVGAWIMKGVRETFSRYDSAGYLKTERTWLPISRLAPRKRPTIPRSC